MPPFHLPGGLLLLTMLGVSWAQHEVTVEQGPLYRTIGTHITIWCKVTGDQGASSQFEFSVRFPSAPDRDINIVSTGDPNFSYAKFSKRVQYGDIYVERVSGDHTVLHIGHLQEQDTGEYECYTPNTGTNFYGTYSAKTNLTGEDTHTTHSMGPWGMSRGHGGFLGAQGMSRGTEDV
ncbi:immunoglobulin superfamily member 3-like [Pyxicephalus adspersus]|uniref:immunoglobulin superfamily member 3-like n=1 Tax=Pyxicephalus adspersus TaxID=30357 RepID=UPI003B5AA95E